MVEDQRILPFFESSKEHQTSMLGDRDVRLVDKAKSVKLNFMLDTGLTTQRSQEKNHSRKLKTAHTFVVLETLKTYSPEN